MEYTKPEPVSEPETKGYKLLAYNTSFVNDCYDNQFHGFLSESASIIAKMCKFLPQPLEGSEITNPYDRLIELLKKNDKEELVYSTLLNTTRQNLAISSTDYIRQKLQEKYDFVALTEQSMHIPSNNHANYDEVMMNILDLTQIIDPKKNEDYGIMKRIATLNQSNYIHIDDVSVVNSNKITELDRSKDTTKTKYNLVYDNVANPDINAGEGIAIIYKAELVTKHLEWKYNENPAYKNIENAIKSKPIDKQTGINSDDALNKLSTKKIFSDPAHFYSDDLGPYVCKDENGKVIYKKSNGLIDNGRPFIMTGGIDSTGKILNLFIAVHGPNVMNLFIQREHLVSLTRSLTKPGKVGLPIPTGDPISLKELDSKILSTIFEKVHKSIEKCIQDGVTAVTNQDVLTGITKVQLFLGGDFNDTRGLILEKLLSKPIEILGKPVSFKYKLESRDTTVDVKSDNKKTEAGYPSLISGCANTDSLKGSVRKIENVSLGPVGVTPNDITKGIYPLDEKTNGVYTYKQQDIFKPPTKKDKDGKTDIPDDTKSSNPVNQLIERIEYIKKNYPDDFINPKNFGYNGDYALFGSNYYANDTKKDADTYVMKIPKQYDPDYETNYKLQEVTSVNETEHKVIASDHLPVYSMVDTEKQLGGRRTRRRVKRSHKKSRVHKLRPRKTRSKKQKARKSRKMRRH
jgi:hypothetical protein